MCQRKLLDLSLESIDLLVLVFHYALIRFFEFSLFFTEIFKNIVILVDDGDIFCQRITVKLSFVLNFGFFQQKLSFFAGNFGALAPHLQAC